MHPDAEKEILRLRQEYGNTLRAWRMGAELAMGDAARRLGVSVEFISDVELGRRPPLTHQQEVKLCGNRRGLPS